ncbi:hypothetical protein HDU97_007952, partial [Phlyctochytrium planicorne]
MAAPSRNDDIQRGLTTPATIPLKKGLSGHMLNGVDRDGDVFLSSHSILLDDAVSPPSGSNEFLQQSQIHVPLPNGVSVPVQVVPPLAAQPQVSVPPQASHQVQQVQLQQPQQQRREDAPKPSPIATTHSYTLRLPDARTITFSNVSPTATTSDLLKLLQQHEMAEDLDLFGAEISVRNPGIGNVEVVLNGNAVLGEAVKEEAREDLRVVLNAVVVTPKNGGSERHIARLQTETGKSRQSSVSLVPPSERSPVTGSPSTDSINVHVLLPYDRIVPITILRMATISTLKSHLYPELAVLPDDLTKFMLYFGDRQLGDHEIVGEVQGILEKGVKLVIEEEKKVEKGAEVLAGWEFLDKSKHGVSLINIHADHTCTTCINPRVECISCSRPFCPTCTRNSPEGKAYFARKQTQSASPSRGKPMVQVSPDKLEKNEEQTKPIVQCMACISRREEREAKSG